MVINQVMIGESKLTRFVGCKVSVHSTHEIGRFQISPTLLQGGAACSIVLRGSSQHFLDEVSVLRFLCARVQMEMIRTLMRPQLIADLNNCRKHII